VQAVALLVVLLCVAEVAVRMLESAPVARGSSVRGLPVRPTWTSRQTLVPMSRLSAVVGDRRVTWATNSLGLRGPEPTVPKPEGVLRIVCLGDERVLGADVTEEQTFCRRLETNLQPRFRRRVEVINAGIPGDCPLLSLLRVRHDLLALDADLWLLTFDMTDVADDFRLRPGVILDRSGMPVACPHPTLRRTRRSRWQSLCQRVHLLNWGTQQMGGLWADALYEAPGEDPGSRQGQYAWLTDSPPDWTVHIEQSLGPIAHLKRMVGGRLVVVTCPAPWQVSRTETQGRDVLAQLGVPANSEFSSGVPFRIIGDFVRRQEIPYWETVSAFRARAGQSVLYQPDRAELSPAGHALMSSVLADHLANARMTWWSTPDESSSVRSVGAQAVSSER